jgi:hypothetical protein
MSRRPRGLGTLPGLGPRDATTSEKPPERLGFRENEPETATANNVRSSAWKTVTSPATSPAVAMGRDLRPLKSKILLCHQQIPGLLVLENDNLSEAGHRIGSIYK